MSVSYVDAGGVPQWKETLLKKKRLQEESKKKYTGDDNRLHQMPEWKRSILQKKKQQQNTRIYSAPDHDRVHDLTRRDSNSSLESPRSVASNNSSNDSDQMLNHVKNVDASSPTIEPEHLLPIEQNPWFVTDPGVKRHRSSKGSVSPRLDNGMTMSYNHQLSNQSDSDDVFNQKGEDEETYEYGQGFVHKLLKKFSHLSNDDQQYNHTPAKRSHSADNLLDDSSRSSTLPRSHSSTDRTMFSSTSQYSTKNSYSTLPTPTKTRSVDDLLDTGTDIHTPITNGDVIPNGDCHDGGSETHYNTDSGSSPCMSPRTPEVTNDKILQDELPRPNTVSSTRSIFESAAAKTKSFSNIRKSKSHDVSLGSGVAVNHYRSRSTSPVGPLRSSSPQPPVNGDVGHDTNDNISTGCTGNGVISHSKSEDNMLHSNSETGPGVARKISTTEESINNIIKAGKSWLVSKDGVEEVHINRFSGNDTSNSNFSVDNSSTTSYNSSIKHNNEVNNRINESDQSFKAGSSRVYNASNHTRSNGESNGTTEHSSGSLHSNTPEGSTDIYSYSSKDRSYSGTNSASIHSDATHNYQSSNAIAKPVRPNSLPQNNREEVPREGESVSVPKSAPANKHLKKSTNSRSNGSSGPGTLLIRPATNIVPASSAAYINMTDYDPIRTGVFKPASKSQSYSYTNNEDDVPVTNIDDISDDVPITYIDDLSPSKSASRKEMDADRQRKATSSQYEFIGAGVTFSKSLLNKSGRGKKLRLHFNDDAIQMFEYPSEASLLEGLEPPPVPMSVPPDSPTSPDEELPPVANLIKNSPSVTSSAGLGSYQSRFHQDYQFGMEVPKAPSLNKPSVPEPSPEETGIIPADEEVSATWSEEQSSDMLF